MVKNGPKVNLQKRPSMNPKVNQVKFSSSDQEALEYGLNQTLQRMINNILTSEKVPLDAKRFQLKQQIAHIFKDTALNEVQAAVWALILERLAWDNTDYSLWFKLLASALYSKEFLGESLEWLIKKYSNKDDKFVHNYQLWKNYCQKIDLTVREINQKYIEINFGKIDKIDYNFYLDEVIFTYQPYQNFNKSKKPELEEDSDLDFFAEMEPVPSKVKRKSKISKVDSVCVKKLSGLLNLDL